MQKFENLVTRKILNFDQLRWSVSDQLGLTEGYRARKGWKLLAYFVA